MSKYKWVSWYQPTEDYRPLSYPPNEDVLGWWCTGERSNGDAVIVAHVRAQTEADAEMVIKQEWPEAEEWRFNNETTQEPPGDRFPLSDWMVERYEQENTNE